MPHAGGSTDQGVSSGESAPNILFLFPDQLRPDWIGYDGTVPVRTPNLTDLLNDGIAFRNAVCPSPICGPSRACLASGREYDRCGVRDHAADYPLAAPTLYERLNDQGYHVVGTGKFDLQKHSSPQGLDGKQYLTENGFSDGVNNAGKWDAYGKGRDGTPRDPYTKFLHEEGLLERHIEDFRDRRHPELSYKDGIDVHATFPTPLPDYAYCDNFVGRQSETLLRHAPTDQPWFLQVNFVGPHNPWDVTDEMHNWYRYPPIEFPEPVLPDDRFDEDKHQAIRRNYAAMVENIDRWIGKLLEVVDERGERDNTIIVFASDHGEMLGDHGQWYKRLPHRPSAEVPFLISGDSVQPRGVVDTPATILDLHATFLDLAGMAPKNVDPCMDSRSMKPYLTGHASESDPPADGGPRDYVFSGFGRWRLALSADFKLIRGFESPEQTTDVDPWDESAIQTAIEELPPILYDRNSDREERTNIAQDRPAVVDQLDEAIDRLRSSG